MDAPAANIGPMISSAEREELFRPGPLVLVPREPTELEAKFDDAFAAAQRAFDPILRTREVEVKKEGRLLYTFKYAPLEGIIAACVPHLNDQAISFRQFIQIRKRNDGFDHFVVTRLKYKGLTVDDEGVLVFRTDATAQAYGGAITYAKRTGATLAFGVAADDDNDGNHGGDDFTVRDRGSKDQAPTRTQGRPPTRDEAKRAVAEAAKSTGNTSVIPPDPKPEPSYTEQQLADMEGKIVDYRDELIEALAEGRRTGIVQIWDEIKGNEYIGTRVWNAIREKHPDLYRTLKETVQPNEGKGPRGPKPRNPDAAPVQGKLA